MEIDTTEESSEFLFDRSKLPFNYDVDKLRQDVLNILADFPGLNVYYNIVPLTNPTGAASSSGDYSDSDWTEWKESGFLRDSPYIKEVLNSLDCEKTNVRLMRLAPGAVIQEHTDPMLDLKFRKQVRLHIPIFTNDAVQFLLNRKVVPLLPGELWYLKLSDPHAVINGGQTERIQLSIDVVVNDWVENMIAQGQAA